MLLKAWRFLAITVVFIFLLNGCEEDAMEPSSKVPITVAIGNEEAIIGTVVQLDGSSSTDPNGDELTYQWAFISKPSNSTTTIIDAENAKAKFTMDKAGIYKVVLSVSDGTSSTTDSLTIKNKTPKITDVRTTTALNDDLAEKGEFITIAGDYFSSDTTEIKITVGGVPYKIIALFDVVESGGYVIDVLVPENAVSGNLKITVGEESFVWPKPIRIISLPVDAFVVENTHLEEKTRNISGSYFEIGARFRPLLNGKAVALTLRMPVNGSYKVTLWDGASKTALVTRTIEITNRNLRFSYLSTEITLEKDKVYMITVNADNWYNHIDEQDSQGNQYPQTIGNFDYLSLGFNDSQATEYPDIFPVNYITKGADIIFAADVQ